MHALISAALLWSVHVVPLARMLCPVGTGLRLGFLLGIFHHVVGHLHDCGVIAAEEPTDNWKRQAILPELQIGQGPDIADALQSRAPHDIVIANAAILTELLQPCHAPLMRREHHARSTALNLPSVTRSIVMACSAGMVPRRTHCEMALGVTPTAGQRSLCCEVLDQCDQCPALDHRTISAGR